MEFDDDASMAKNNMSTDCDDATMTVDVAVDGDIIMIVGPEQRKFRVHSIMLKSASKVFEAMLGPNFAEGHQLRSNGHRGEITKIELLEDDVDGMGTILYLLHHRVDKIPDSLPARILFQIGVAADKYDLIATLKNTVIGTIYRIIGQGEQLMHMDMLDIWYLAMTTACFNDPANFKTLTLALVWYHDNAFVDLAKEAAIDDALAYRLSDLLEMQRSKIRSEIYRAVLIAGSKSRRHDHGSVTIIDWPRTDCNVWEMADILTKRSLYVMWNYINKTDMKFGNMEDIYIDGFGELPGMKGIRKTGMVLLEDARKPSARNGVGSKRP